MIRSFRHRGLRRLYETGGAKGLPAESITKLENMLGVIDHAETVAEIGIFPGWRMHRLKGEFQGFWSLTVTGNWRLMFRFDGGDAFDLDFVDYH